MKIYFDKILWSLFAFFLCAALYFTIGVERFKSRLNVSAENLNFSSGQKVNVLKVIDGDEISVKMDNSQFIVRILGISSYEPSVNDPMLENVAKDAFHYLESTILEKEVELVFEKFQQDKDKRVLAYVYYNGVDIGRHMIANGLSIVFTRYPFPRMDEYLNSENKAIRAKKGLWNVPAAAERSLMLKKIWQKGTNN